MTIELAWRPERIVASDVRKKQSIAARYPVFEIHRMVIIEMAGFVIVRRGMVVGRSDKWPQCGY